MTSEWQSWLRDPGFAISASQPYTVLGAELARWMSEGAGSAICKDILLVVAKMPQANGVLLRAYDAVQDYAARAPVRITLSEHQQSRWRDSIRNLIVLLDDSGALKHGVVLYESAGALMCEIGPPGRTFLIAIDDEGVSTSYRAVHDDFGSYVSHHFSEFPLLPEFLETFQSYLRAGPDAWMKSTANLTQICRATKPSVAAFATTQPSLSSTAAMAAFASS